MLVQVNRGLVRKGAHHSDANDVDRHGRLGAARERAKITQHRIAAAAVALTRGR